eukprot:scaffold24740_cov66-Attheya_sp.AAC.1
MGAVTVDNLGGTKVCKSVKQAGYHSYLQQPSNSSYCLGPIRWISHLVPILTNGVYEHSLKSVVIGDCFDEV